MNAINRPEISSMSDLDMVLTKSISLWSDEMALTCASNADCPGTPVDGESGNTMSELLRDLRVTNVVIAMRLAGL